MKFGQIDYEQWETPRIREKDVLRKQRNYGVRVMFPSSHDITLENIETSFTVLYKLLEAGNEVLLVSKPRYEIIRSICDNFAEYRDKILFRFTITATDNSLLSFWEPNAPSYEERREALRYAFEAGFETSVSAEPMLDAEHIDELVEDLSPFINHSLWIGKMNHFHYVKIDSPEVEAELEKIRAGQTDDNIKAIYARHKDNPIIRWKGCIKKIVGIQPAEKPGMDI